MEWIFIGIMICIGFYLAPIVLTAVVACIMAVGFAIAKIFEVIFGSRR